MRASDWFLDATKLSGHTQYMDLQMDRPMEAFAQWLAGTSFSHGVQRTLWLIPVLQSIHILGIAVVLSSVAMIELRIVGVVKSQTMIQTAHRFLPWLWAGLILLAATGI